MNRRGFIKSLDSGTAAVKVTAKEFVLLFGLQALWLIAILTFFGIPLLLLFNRCAIFLVCP